MKPFRLQYYRPGMKVVTREGNKVHILTTSLNNERCIIAIVEVQKNCQKCCCYYPSGKELPVEWESGTDLFFADNSNQSQLTQQLKLF